VRNVNPVVKITTIGPLMNIRLEIEQSKHDNNEYNITVDI